jgi:hypothetical protein
MQHSQNSEKLEEVAREAGAQWGTKMRAQYLRADRTIGSWPGTLDDARRLIDSTVGRDLEEEERELLALLAERGARRVWNDFASSPPVSTVQAIASLNDERPAPVRSRYGA